LGSILELKPCLKYKRSLICT